MARPACGGRQAGGLLQEQPDDEHAERHPGVEEHGGQVPHREVAGREDVQRHHRVRRSPLPQRERDQAGDTDHETGDHRRMREAQPLPLDERVHRAGEADRVQRRPDDVDARRPIRRRANSSAGSLVVRYSVIASGTMLTPKIHRQFSASTNTPPSSGPITKAVPVQAVQVPMARAWAAPEKRALIIASELGTRNAAPTPCRQRAATRTQPVGATAHNTEDTAKTARPDPQHGEPAELVGDRAGHQDQRAEGQQVAVDDPLLQRQAAAEFASDGRQCEVDHRAVEEGDERGQHGDRDQRSVGTGGATRHVVGLSGHPAAPRPNSRCVRPREGSVGGLASAPSCAWMARCAARMAR